MSPKCFFFVKYLSSLYNKKTNEKNISLNLKKQKKIVKCVKNTVKTYTQYERGRKSSICIVVLCGGIITIILIQQNEQFFSEKKDLLFSNAEYHHENKETFFPTRILKHYTKKCFIFAIFFNTFYFTFTDSYYFFLF